LYVLPLLCSLALPSARALAQASNDTRPARAPHLTRADAIIASGFVVGALALMPFDEQITHAARARSLQESSGLSSTATVFRLLGDPGSLLLGVGAYGTGRVLHSEPLADIGWHVTEAIILSGTVTALIKTTAGRARPYAVADSNSRDYEFGRGFRGGGAYQSLPSGHATAAFAAAAVVSTEARRRWPARAGLVSGAAYGAATMTALSRIYNDKHWASDVALAAGVGIVSARVLQRAHHQERWRGVDRWILPSNIAVGTGGALRVEWRPFSEPSSLGHRD
jgi:membrane-associated phospholipid phosphatase